MFLKTFFPFSSVRPYLIVLFGLFISHLLPERFFSFLFFTLISCFHIEPLRMFLVRGSVRYRFISIYKAPFSLLFLAHSLSVCLVLSLKLTPDTHISQFTYVNTILSRCSIRTWLSRLSLLSLQNKHTIVTDQTKSGWIEHESFFNLNSNKQ